MMMMMMMILKTQFFTADAVDSADKRRHFLGYPGFHGNHIKALDRPRPLVPPVDVAVCGVIGEEGDGVSAGLGKQWREGVPRRPQHRLQDLLSFFMPDHRSGEDGERETEREGNRLRERERERERGRGTGRGRVREGEREERESPVYLVKDDVPRLIRRDHTPLDEVGGHHGTHGQVPFHPRSHSSHLDLEPRRLREEDLAPDPVQRHGMETDTVREPAQDPGLEIAHRDTGSNNESRDSHMMSGDAVVLPVKQVCVLFQPHNALREGVVGRGNDIAMVTDRQNVGLRGHILVCEVARQRVVVNVSSCSPYDETVCL